MVENITNLISSGNNIVERINLPEINEYWEVIVSVAEEDCKFCPYRKECRIANSEPEKKVNGLQEATKVLKNLQYKRTSAEEAARLLNKVYVSLLGCPEEQLRIDGFDED
ncbi:hypothetical protein IKG45_01635 [Candidatus Saccharibacteria bacterium]|nr:hypothetical protein [Candidatus Saccharibacteria bacterium]